ncbi:MAG: hypothetical protein ACI87L_002169 [Litorivivens sp.]|jgi:hypothetical protein
MEPALSACHATAAKANSTASSARSVPGRLARSFGLLVLQVFVVASVGAQSFASGFSSEERLEAIRQGLVQAALEGATRVESMAWIDGQGVLREGSSFRSGMDVRGVQVLNYVRDNSGQPQARLQLPPRQDLLKRPATASPCANSAALRHVIGFRMTLEGGWSVDEAPLAQALGQHTASLLQQSGGVASAWAVLPRPAPAQTDYERLLLATSADQLPWQANLLVKPAPPLAATGAARYLSVMVRLHFSLVARGQTRPAFESSVQLEVPRHAQAWGRPQLEAAARAQASQLIQPWVQALSAQFSCEAVLPEVTAVRGPELSINAGTLAGVRAGDEWLLADPQRFPQQILASGVAATAVLARVGQVYPHHAQLQIVAGPSDTVRTDWRAWRADSPILPTTVQR